MSHKKPVIDPKEKHNHYVAQDIIDELNPNDRLQQAPKQQKNAKFQKAVRKITRTS